MSRAYLRVDPMLFERKVIQQGYGLPLFAAFMATLCEAEHQPVRGRFRSESIVRALLGPAARHVPELIRRGDLIRAEDGSLYVDGWDEWQEGDWKVGERVRRIRERRRRVTPPTVTDATVATVYTPSDGRRQSVIDSGGVSGSDSPPPPSPARGRRKDATNSRATGDNPRATGESPRQQGTSQRQEREAQKRGPTAIPAILARLAAEGEAT